MTDYQVTCITPDGADADRRIDRLGGPNWNDAIDNVIGFIESGAHRFYVFGVLRHTHLAFETRAKWVLAPIIQENNICALSELDTPVN